MQHSIQHHIVFYIKLIFSLNYRWGEQAAENLPANLKALYINILNTTNDIEEELKHQKNKNPELVKDLVSVFQDCTKLAKKRTLMYATKVNTVVFGDFVSSNIFFVNEVIYKFI